MKGIHIPFTWHPDAVGGTEVYVEMLVRHLAELGVTSTIVAPGGSADEYTREGVAVVRFEAEFANLQEQYAGISSLTGRARRILERLNPDFVHFHSFVPAHSIPFAAAASSMGVPSVFTYHTPTASCARGTMMLFGHEACDGRIESDRCCRCALEGLGVPRTLASLVSLAAPALGRSSLWFPRPVGTVLGTRRLLDLRSSGFREFIRSVSAVVSLANWVTQTLSINGVPAGKIVEIPHGIDSIPRIARRHPRPDGPARFAFVGRLSKEKGLELICEILRKTAGVPYTLEVFGIDQGAPAEELRDPRVSLTIGLPRVEVLERLRQVDALLVPSQWLETGPLVVLEARALGVPVLASDLGGIVDKVEEGMDGFILPHRDANAWVKVIRSISANPDLLLKLLPRPVVRSMAEVAESMLGVYADITHGARVQALSQDIAHA